MKTRLSKISLGLIVLCSLFMQGCPDKGRNGGATVVQPPPCYGTACGQGGVGTLLAQAIGSTNNNTMHLGLIFNQTGATAGQVGYYSGQAVATGSLTVTAPVQRYACPIPAGTYTITTITPASWSALSFTELRLQAVGPASLQIRLPSNFIQAVTPAAAGPDGLSYPYRLKLDMYVETLNGQSCYVYGMNFGSFVLE